MGEGGGSSPEVSPRTGVLEALGTEENGNSGSSGLLGYLLPRPAGGTAGLGPGGPLRRPSVPLAGPGPGAWEWGVLIGRGGQWAGPGQGACSKHRCRLLPSCEAAAAIPVLQTGRLRHREVKWLTSLPVCGRARIGTGACLTPECERRPSGPTPLLSRAARGRLTPLQAVYGARCVPSGGHPPLGLGAPAATRDPLGVVLCPFPGQDTPSGPGAW